MPRRKRGTRGARRTYNHEFEAQLDDASEEWLRYRIQTEAGDVIAFTLQYETTIAGKRTPVVRYDTSHGYAHRDHLDHSGRVIDKFPLPDNPPFKEALQACRSDILARWRRYRAEFREDEP